MIAMQTLMCSISVNEQKIILYHATYIIINLVGKKEENLQLFSVGDIKEFTCVCPRIHSLMCLG